MRVGKLIVLGSLLIIGVSFLLWFAKPQKTWSIIIQADAIITLILVTWVYAKRTKDLVDQEKIALEDQIKKRRADFGKKLLEEFYVPFKSKLAKMKGIIKVDPNSIKQVVIYRKELLELISGHENIITRETHNAIVDLLAFMPQIEDIKKEDKKSLGRWKEKEEAKVKKANDYINKEIAIIESAICNVYGFFIDFSIEKPKF